MISLPTLAVATVVTEDMNEETRKSLIDNALPIAGLFVLVLGIALFLLWRSMNRQMKKIDPALPDGPDDREQAADREMTAEAVERGETTDDAERS